jgi:hypothetical protein
LLVIALLQPKMKFRGAELATIFTMLFWGMYGYQFSPREVAVSFLFGGKYGWKGILEKTRPWVATVIPSYYGNVFFWVAGSIIFTYMMIFYQYIWRRQIQEIERLPFPMSQIPISLMQATVTRDEKDRSALLTNRMFWSGFLVALVWMIPTITSVTANLFHIPSPIKMGYGTGINEPKETESAVAIGGQAVRIDLTPLTYVILPNADTRLVIGLAHIAIGYFLPTDVAISSTIAWILFWWIIPPIQVAMGIFPVLSKPGTMAYWGWTPINIRDDRGLLLNWSVIFALPFALGLMSIILHRRYFIETIRAAIKGTRIGVEGWQDPYRLYWLGFIVCLLLSIAWGIAFGASPLVALFVIAFSWVMMAGLIRVGGEAWMHPQSWWYPPLSFESIAIVNPGFPSVEAQRNLASLAASNFGGVRSNDWNPGGFWGSPGGGWGDGIGVMRIGQELRGRLKDILIITAVGILLSSIVTAVTTEWYNSMFPFRYGETMTVSTGYGAGWAQVESPGTDWPTRMRQWTYFAIGVVLWSIVMILRMRFAWFIINPVGFMLPWTVHFFMVNCFGVTIAWILKRIAIRLGGPKLVDKLQWFFVGAIVGLSMVTFYGILGGSLGPIRGFGKPRCICGA